MNIGELKKIIANIPDDVEMFAMIHGHEMVKVSAEDWHVCRAAYSYWQYFDAEAVNKEYETPIRALVIG